MVGNSWYDALSKVLTATILIRNRIYKSKYKDKMDQDAATEVPEKKPRNKSRTRTMFGRIKSHG